MESANDSERKRGKGRPTVDSEAISLRLPRELLDALDDLRLQERDQPARPEMIRRMMIGFLETIEKRRSLEFIKENPI